MALRNRNGSTPRLGFALALLLAVGLGLSPVVASAQVYINEILPNPTGTDTGTERVEIYNAGPAAVDLTGWAIDDAVTIGATGTRRAFPRTWTRRARRARSSGPASFASSS